jgi:hypothetical protein
VALAERRRAQMNNPSGPQRNCQFTGTNAWLRR